MLVLFDQQGEREGELLLGGVVLVQVGDEDTLAGRQTLVLQEQPDSRDTVQLLGTAQGRLGINKLTNSFKLTRKPFKLIQEMLEINKRNVLGRFRK